MKYGDQIEILSQIVGAIHHLFEYSTGKITGEKHSMKTIITSMQSKTFLSGLELDFGEQVFQSIITLINTDKIEIKDNLSESKKAA